MLGPVWMKENHISFLPYWDTRGVVWRGWLPLTFLYEMIMAVSIDVSYSRVSGASPFCF